MAVDTDGYALLLDPFTPPEIVARPLCEMVGTTKTVSLDSDLIRTARALGVTFGG